MRVFIAVLVILFSFQSWTKADDIKDFEIEGFFLGESLLTFFAKEKIDQEINSKWALKYNNEFIQVGIGYSSAFPLSKKLKNYNEVTIVLKANDNNYRIFSVSGKIFCGTKEKCLSQKKNISADLENFFGNSATVDHYTKKHAADKTGNSTTYNSEFDLKETKDRVAVSYYDWSKKFEEEKGYKDNIKVIIHSYEFHKFLLTYYDK